jgi:hypothetical protein
MAPRRQAPFVHTRARDVTAAFLALAVIDVTLRTVGYRRVRTWLRRVDHGGAATPVHPSTLASLTAAVDRAMAYYPRETMCLQRSATLTWLLRRVGVAAELVIGCRHTPFYAHAWVEVDRVVVNDTPAVRDKYAELERL